METQPDDLGPTSLGSPGLWPSLNPEKRFLPIKQEHNTDEVHAEGCSVKLSRRWVTLSCSQRAKAWEGRFQSDFIPFLGSDWGETLVCGLVYPPVPHPVPSGGGDECRDLGSMCGFGRGLWRRKQVRVCGRREPRCWFLPAGSAESLAELQDCVLRAGAVKTKRPLHIQKHTSKG